MVEITRVHFIKKLKMIILGTIEKTIVELNGEPS